LPLIAFAYAAFAAGLLLGFERSVWIAVATGSSVIVSAFFTKRIDRAGLGLLVIGGALIAATSSAEPGDFRRSSEERSGDHSGRSFLEGTQARASRSIDKLFGADAPMARALLIADQHRIPPEMRDRYARAGMVHMLSISGLHVAIVAGAVVLLLQAARIPRMPAAVLGVVITAFYVAVIGAPAPAVRSAVMLGAVSASRLTQRPTSPWAGLALGAFAPLVAPMTVLDLGYQLSVAGIAGLIASGTLSRRLLSTRLDGWRLKMSKELLTSIVATLVTAPLIAWYFGRVSLIAPLANLAAGPVISVLQPTLFAALALAPIPAAAQLFADAAHPMLLMFDAIAKVAAEVPGASPSVVPSIVAVIAGSAGSIALIVACMSRYPVRPVIAGASCIAIMMWAPAFPLPYGGGVEMHVLDVGQGDAILFRSNRGRWVIFDAGRIWESGDAGRSTIIPYVMSRGGSVEAFVLSHAHADHVGGAESVMRALRPDEFWDSAFPQGSGVYEKTLVAAREAGVSWHRVHPDEEFAVDGMTVRFLAPDSAWTAALSDPNEASTIALVEYGTTRFLLVGDAEAAEEAWLVDHARPDIRADVLKVGHHGSSTSSTDHFLDAVNPALAVISVGADNIYGHPSADVLAALDRLGVRTVRTDLAGTIVVTSDGTHLSMEASGERWDISRR
jgi:competence protein ComEC